MPTDPLPHWMLVTATWAIYVSGASVLVGGAAALSTWALNRALRAAGAWLAVAQWYAERERKHREKGADNAD